MLLKRLELENIRSYRREVIEFQEGVALFEGDIGSGKSTILYAIEFALFGLGDLKSTFLLRSGEKEGRVTLVLDVDGCEISFSRSLERKKSGASQKQCYIITGGVKAEYSPEEMKAEVLKILRFNENPSPTATSLIFRYAIFTPQEEMKEILRLREDSRLETLRRAFGIEEYKIARNNAALVSKQIKERETFLLGSLAGLGALESQRNDLAGSIEKTDAELAEAVARSDAISKKSAVLEKKITEHRQIKAEFDNISGSVPALRKMLSDKQALLLRAEKLIAGMNEELAWKRSKVALLEAEKKPTEKTQEEIESELNAMRADINLLSAQAGALKSSVKEAEAALRDTEAKKIELEKTEIEIKRLGVNSVPTEKTDAELAREITDLRAQRDALLPESGAALEQSKALKRLISEKVCPTCGQDIDPSEFLKKSEDAGKSAQVMEAELKALMQKEKELQIARDSLGAYNLKMEKLSGLMKQKEILSGAYDAAMKKCAALEEMRKSMAHIDAELSALAAKEHDAIKLRAALSAYVLAGAQISAMRSEIDSMQARLESEEAGRKAAVLEISALSKEADEKEREMERLKLAVSGLAALEAELSGIKAEQDIASKRVAEAGARKNAFVDALKKIEAEILAKDAEKKEKEELSEIRMWLDDYFSGALVSIERHVLASINEEFNVLFARLFGILMDENELNVTINEFFTPSVVQNGYEQDIGALSGGERTSVALAYRLALNSVVKNVCGGANGSSLLILDEPTDGFSKEQLMRLRDVLAELACKQVVIVSHERELESFADHIYRVTKGAGGVSVVEKG